VLDAVKSWFKLLIAVVIVLYGVSQALLAEDEKPSVRAVTAFIRLDHATFEGQIKETLRALQRISDALKHSGYPVQTIRISTQPFLDYARGLSDEEALRLFGRFDELAEKEGFMASIGPVFHAEDVERLIDVLAATKNLNASLTVADEHGVRWKSVRQAAVVVKRLQETRGGLGNFNFASAALVPPNGPFYPVSYQQGRDKQFAVGLQSADVVANVFAAAKDPVAARDGLEKVLGTHAHHVEAICKRLEVESEWKLL
jgi:uncharacterized protein (UPF0210 family)